MVWHYSTYSRGISIHSKRHNLPLVLGLNSAEISPGSRYASSFSEVGHFYMAGLRDESGQSVFQWKNPDFLLKNPDFRWKDPDFLLKKVDFVIKTGTEPNPKEVYGWDQQAAGAIDLTIEVGRDRAPSVEVFLKAAGEFWIQNDEFCIKYDELCIKNDDICIENVGLCSGHDGCVCEASTTALENGYGGEVECGWRVGQRVL